MICNYNDNVHCIYFKDGINCSDYINWAIAKTNKTRKKYAKIILDKIINWEI